MKIEKLQTAIVWRLPRWVIKWAFIRAMAYATQVYHDKQPDEIGLMTALEAWDKEAR